MKFSRSKRCAGAIKTNNNKKFNKYETLIAVLDIN